MKERLGLRERLRIWVSVRLGEGRKSRESLTLRKRRKFMEERKIREGRKLMEGIKHREGKGLTAEKGLTAGKSQAAGKGLAAGKSQRWLAAAVALAVGMGIFMTGCAKKTSGAVERIQALGNLRVAIVDTQSRYTKLDGDTPVGIEPDLVQWIADALGVTTQYQVCNKADALAAVAAGEADIALGGINHSGSLSGDYLLSTEYGKGYFYAVTRAGDYVLTIGALEGSSVGVDRELDEETRTKLYQAEGIRITDYGSAAEGKDGVKNGTIRAYICYEDQAKTFMEDETFQVQNLSNLEPEEFVIVAGKSDTALINGINTLIRQFLEKE